MRIIDSYLIGNLFLGFAAAAALLLPLFSTLDLVGELDDVGKNGYRLIEAFEVVVMTLPRRAVELGPFIALLGGIAGLGQLSMTHELSILHTAGISLWRIGMTALLAGLALALALAALDEFVASPLQQKALHLRAQAMTTGAEGRGKEGSVWGRRAGEIVRIGALQFGRVPVHLEIFSFDDRYRLEKYIFAEYADIQPEGIWRLHKVQLKRWNGDEQSIERHDQLLWRSVLPDTRLNEITLPAESLSTRQLYRYVQFLRHTAQPAAQYEVALWQKLGVPLLTLAMILFSIPFTVGRGRAKGLGGKLAIGAVVGLLIYMADQILVNLGLLFKLEPLLVGMLPALVLLGIAMALVRRFDRSR